MVRIGTNLKEELRSSTVGIPCENVSKRIEVQTTIKNVEVARLNIRWHTMDRYCVREIFAMSFTRCVCKRLYP
uniref:Uncharacterized protein n=1 Tax=Oryza punctata TaxID=4537 RepID=A0A0E0M2R4_ORYPU